MIDISIISHGHGGMVDDLIEVLLKFRSVSKVLLTQNLPEFTKFLNEPKVQVFNNLSPKGFGFNHNRASSNVTSPFFCIVNPDVVFASEPFSKLLRTMNATSSDMIAPMVVNSSGQIEDSARIFPGLYSLLSKLVGIDRSAYRLNGSSGAFHPEWVAGMFMLFDIKSYRKVGGFDEGFFLYYEDVDICARMWKSGMKIVCDPQVAIVHNAQRASRSQFKFMVWHLSSMIRYFVKHWGRLPVVGAN